MKSTKWVKIAALGILLYQSALPLAQVVHAEDLAPPVEVNEAGLKSEGDVILSGEKSAPKMLNLTANEKQTTKTAGETLVTRDLDETTEADFTFEDSTGTITGLTEDGKQKTHLKIPSSIGGVAVKELAAGAFLDEKAGEVVKLSFAPSDQLTSLGNSTFGGAKLIDVDLSGLTGLTSIGNYIFKDCNDLAKITFDKDTTKLTSIGNYTFERTNLTELDLSSLTSLTSIGTGTFKGCTELTQVNFGTGLNNLTSVGYNTFEESGLAKIDLSGLTSLASIGSATFRGCTELTQVNFGTGLTELISIGNATFERSGLTEVDLSSLTNLSNMGQSPFKDCANLSKVEFGKGLTKLTSIGDMGTFERTNLTEVDLSGLTSLETIGWNVFAGTKLTEVDLSGLTNLTSIGDGTFSNTADLKTLYAGNQFSKITGFLASDKSGLADSVLVAQSERPVDFYVRDLNTNQFPTDALKGKEFSGCTVGALGDVAYQVSPPELTIPTGLALEWREEKDLNGSVVDLATPAPTAFKDEYYGSYTFTDPASLTINPAKTEALYDGKEHGLTKDDIYLKEYPDYTLPITKIEYQLDNDGFSETPPKAEGTYQVQITVAGQDAPIVLTDTIVINPIAKYTVTFETRGNGDLAGRPTATVEENKLIQGDQVPTPKADKGHIFSKWIDESGKTVDNITEIVITKDRTFTAVFKAVAEDVKLSVLHRLYNPNSGEHFYTLDPDEKDNLVKHGWDYEDIAGSQPTNKGEAVYRMYNPNEGGEHHYTPLKEEVEFLKKAGWNYEGVAFKTGGNKSVHRLYNENAVTGTHHYTQLDSELSWLKGLGWSHEGTGWYSY